MQRIFIALSLTLPMTIACGGSAEPAPAQPAAQTAPADQTAPAGEEHEHDFPPAVAGFHDRLAPLWHAEAGPQRVDDTCKSIDDLEGEAGPMHDGTPVAEDQAQAYFQAVGDLKSALGELRDACDEDGRPNFDAAFTKVHEAFHAVIAFFGHQESGEHEGHEGH